MTGLYLGIPFPCRTIQLSPDRIPINDLLIFMDRTDGKDPYDSLILSHIKLAVNILIPLMSFPDICKNT